MDVEHGQRADEQARVNDEQTKITGVCGDDRAPDRSGLAGTGSDDRSGLLGHFRSPSKAGLAGPEPPNSAGLTGGHDATDRSGLFGRTGATHQRTLDEDE